MHGLRPVSYTHLVEPDSTRWNALATRAIAAIREVDADHAIVIGGIDYNNVWKLKDMPIFDDPKVCLLYTSRCV